MAERQEKAEDAKVKRQASVESIEVDVQASQQKVEFLQERLNTWKQLLKALVAPSNHDLCTNHDMRWSALFEQLLERQVEDIPQKFLAGSSVMEFEDVIVEVSAHISSLQKDFNKGANMLQTKTKTLQVKKERVLKIEEQSKIKAEKIIEIKESGKEDEILESHRPFDKTRMEGLCFLLFANVDSQTWIPI